MCARVLRTHEAFPCCLVVFCGGCCARAQILIIAFIVCPHAIMVQEFIPCICLLGLSTVTSVEQSIMFASPRRAGQKRRVDRSWLGLKGKYQPLETKQNFSYSWATKDISGSGFRNCFTLAWSFKWWCHASSLFVISRKDFWRQKAQKDGERGGCDSAASWSLACGGSETVNPCLRRQSGQLSLSRWVVRLAPPAAEFWSMFRWLWLWMTSLTKALFESRHWCAS